MAVQKLQFVIDAENKADQALKSVSSNLETMQDKLDKLGPTFKKMAGVGTVAFGAISAIAVSSFKASADAAAQMDLATNTLNNTLETMSVKGLNKLQQSVGEGIDIFEAMEQKMKDAGKAAVQMAFDDETAATAYSRLFQVTGDAEKAQSELNLAMDLARFSGQDLSSATDALIKVHAGGTRVLKDFGIEVKEGTTATEALALVQLKTAGAAQTFADSAAGGMARIQIQMDNLQETVGDALAPAFQKVFAAIQPTIEKFAEWAEQNPELLAKILLVVGGIAALVAGVGAAGLAITALMPVLSALGAVLAFLAANPIVLIVAGVGFLIYKFVQLVQATGSVSGAFKALGDTLKEWWNNIGEWILGKVNALIDAFNRLSIVQAAKGAFSTVSNFVGGRAIGGPVSSNTPYMVGERGPELFVPGNAGRIMPNNMLGAGSSVIINITGNSFMGADDMAEQVGDQLMRILKRQTKI